MTNEIKELLDKPKILMLSYGNYISLNDYVKLKDYITNLQEKYDKSLELLSDFFVPCECVDCKIPDEYCEKNCNDDYKKCWNKYIETILRGDE